MDKKEKAENLFRVVITTVYMKVKRSIMSLYFRPIYRSCDICVTAHSITAPSQTVAANSINLYAHVMVFLPKLEESLILLQTAFSG